MVDLSFVQCSATAARKIATLTAPTKIATQTLPPVRQDLLAVSLKTTGFVLAIMRSLLLILLRLHCQTVKVLIVSSATRTA